jgi:succinate dehydrogenase/fumarate reductase flavoprotein subunit
MSMDRRGFLKAGVLAGGAAALAGLVGCATETPEASQKTYLPETWDVETDILVIGAGAAGLAAAITVLSEELGEVLVLEHAPEEEAGGNTRVSGQVLFIPLTPADAITYQTHLNAEYVVDDDLMQAWAENLCENYAWLTDFGANLLEARAANPEFPEVEGAQGCKTFLHDGVTGQAHLYDFLKETADDLGYTIEYSTRATRLIFDPATKEVFGVRAEKGGSPYYAKARKGVILACGGFENNPEMLRTYYPSGYTDILPGGTPYNMGDGITMTQAIGAKFWHMNSFALSWLGVPISRNCPSTSYPSWKSKDYIYIAPTGKRYTYEETMSLTKHGKMLQDGVYVSQHVPLPQHVVFGQAAFEAGPIFPDYPYNWPGMVSPKISEDNQGFLDAGIIIKAETARELAEKIGINPTALETTINDYNAYCANGKDLDYGRGEDFYGNFGGMGDPGGIEERVVIAGFPLVALQPPFYAMREYMTILNTQGGPKHNVLGQVVDIEGEGIPRLFAAGELGCEYSYEYNGGGNVSGAISSGRLAARSISKLTSWEA